MHQIGYHKFTTMPSDGSHGISTMPSAESCADLQAPAKRQGGTGVAAREEAGARVMATEPLIQHQDS